jgi:hypothetical protein
MRTVLYAHDMEPITVLELTPWAADFLAKRGEVRLAIQRPVAVHVMPPIEPPDFRSWQVLLTAEWFVRRGERHMFVFTSDEENAMLLRAAFLPGQRGELRERENAAMAQGFLKAFALLGRE